MKLYPVIMAGGSGTRFWPLSRKKWPKQFLALSGSKPLIAETAERLPPLAKLPDSYVVCGKLHAAAVRKLVPRIPAKHVLVEPVAKNTAPAIGLAAAVIAKSDPGGVLAILPSDHHIGNAPGFRKALAAAARYAATGALVTLGVKPSRPETGYGYVQLGERIDAGPGCRVRAFVEKPDAARAQQYLASGDFVWNAGIFLFRADAILREIRAHLSALADGLDALAPHVGKKSFDGALARIFPKMPSISIDYGVMEKARNIVVVPAEFGWSDVGSFAALPEVRPADRDGNVTSGLALPLGARNCVVLAQAKRPLAVIGLDDVIAVDAGDAILVCPKSKAQDVRKAVEELQKRKLTRLV